MQQSRIGGPSRQRRAPTLRIDNISVRAVSLKDAPHVADIVKHAGNENVREVAGARRCKQRAPLHDVVANQRYQHGVLNIVVERVAIADAFQSKSGDRGHQFG